MDCRIIRHLVLLMLVCGACAANALSPEVTIGQINAERIAVEGISIGLPEQQIVALLGRPISIIKKPMDTSISTQSTTYEFDGLVVNSTDGAISAVVCTNPKYKTRDGARVGDDQSKLLNLYGPAVGKQQGGENLLWWYARRGTQSATPHLVFHLRENRVVKIEMDSRR